MSVCPSVCVSLSLSLSQSLVLACVKQEKPLGRDRCAASSSARILKCTAPTTHRQGILERSATWPRPLAVELVELFVSRIPDLRWAGAARRA